ncbi:unnamed protein product [Knipowitschia caucasica]|uniref:Uncharacterized protein n=1 Tax=Knipowitschia caucasica TaxID=637954 RepID=A0AAV2JR62_KNICA
MNRPNPNFIDFLLSVKRVSHPQCYHHNCPAIVAGRLQKNYCFAISVGSTGQRPGHSKQRGSPEASPCEPRFGPGQCAAR